MNELWLRQPDESAQAYAAFCVYRDLGAERSLQEVVRRCNKSVSILGRWSSRWEWVARARAYDEHQAALLEQEREQALKAKAEEWAQRKITERNREWEMAELLYQKGKDILDRPVAARAIGPKGLADVAAGLEKAAKLARLAAEMETDRQRLDVAVQQEIEGALDLLRDNLSTEDYAKVVAILARGQG